MARKSRAIFAEEPYHLVQRGNKKERVFDSPEDYLEYCHIINNYAEKYKVSILAYCLMSNHIHLVAVPANDRSISSMFKIAQMKYSRYKNKQRNTQGHIWHSRFFSERLDETHMHSVIRYVENNPVRANISNRPENYKWSSSRYHLGFCKKPDIYLAGSADLLDISKTPQAWQAYLSKEPVPK